MLTEIRNRQRIGKPYQASEWHAFCKRHDFSEGKYQDVKAVLLHNGLINKTKHEFMVSEDFITNLSKELIEFLLGQETSKNTYLLRS